MQASERAARPGPDEHAPYYSRYIERVPDGDIVITLDLIRRETLELLRTISEERSMFAYAPEKWNIREVLGHVADGERVFSYRALWFARRSEHPLPSMEENEFAKYGGHARRSWNSIVAEYDHVRTATIDLFDHLDAESFLRTGIAGGQQVSVRGLAWIIAGHDLHHREMIKTRYLA
ncbi:MAG: DinB family protein [candidate division Zixibacteria bacterium]|nr:DinB family protein [candidate division Zixibacteria bacterium]